MIYLNNSSSYGGEWLSHVCVQKGRIQFMSSEQASEIQRNMYEFIVKYMKSEGMPPTNREIGRERQIASTGHVDYHLTIIKKKALIAPQPKKSRGIKLTAKEPRGVPIMGPIPAGEPLDIYSEPE